MTSVISFGESVRAAREARGWTQHELASRVGVSQRAVSNWENLVSEPKEATKRAVAAVLGLEADESRRAATRMVATVESPANFQQRADRNEAGAALLSELPLEALAPDEFEDFSYSLAQALFPDAEAYRQGKSGHTQHGFDVLVEAGDKILVGIQCKRVQEFGPREVQKAVAVATERVDRALIFLSRSASPDARAAVRAHPGWELWDKNKLSQKVHELHKSASVRLVDRYFPLLRERFLGIPLPGPWLRPTDYFERVSRSKQYSHQWTLVGQDDLLSELTQFASVPAGGVGVLVGRGGVGKSKLLHALSAQLAPSGTEVRFLEREPTLDHRSFEQLPPGRLLVVVDDAQDDDAPIGKVVAGVREVNEHANILLALRPHGEIRARRQLRDNGLQWADVPQWRIPELQTAEAEALTREVLGPSYAGAAPRLAAVARDCPFLLIAGALRVQQGALDLRRFESDARLRRELIESLLDTLPSGFSDQPEVREQVLSAVAALQPVQTADSDFRAVLEFLTDRPFDQVAQHLAAWEEAGVLLRRSETYRIVPDLLGDALLARAAFIRETGALTNYIERVRRHASGQALANLLVNAGRVDWQEAPGRRGGLTNKLWESIQTEFQTVDGERRAALLGVVAKVAFYEPQPSVNVVEWAVSNPAPPVEVEVGFGMTHIVKDQDVRDAAALVLRNAAYDPDVFPKAVELLWEIGRGDARPRNQHPNHALRMLADLAGYDRRGVTEYQQMLPAIVERWLRRARRDSDIFDPLTVLHPLLSPEGRGQTWSRDALILHSFPINPEWAPVAELRRRVLDLVFQQLTSGDDRRAVAAAEVIGLALTGPLGRFAGQSTQLVREAWVRSFKETVAQLYEVVRAKTLTPVVCAALRSYLKWPTEHIDSGFAAEARAVISAMPCGPEYELARGLHGGPADPPEDPETLRDYLARQRAQEEFMLQCVSALDDWGLQRVVDQVEVQLGKLQEALGDEPTRARPFISALVTGRPEVGEAMCARVREDPEGRLLPLLSAIVSMLAKTGVSDAVAIAHRLLDDGDVAVARQIALGFGVQRARKGVLADEPALLRRLVAYPDREGVVTAEAIGVLRVIGAESRDLAMDLLASVPEGQRQSALITFAELFGPHGQFSWADLNASYKASVQDVLIKVDSIERYEVAEFLVGLSFEDPGATLAVLTGRIEKVEAGESARGYTALPYTWPYPLRFRELSDFPEWLRRVREWLAEAPESMWRHYMGSDLFARVAGQFDEQTRQIIEEYLDDPTPLRIRVVATMLRGAPGAMVWDSDFVRRCLLAADACGAKSLEAIQAALYSTLFTGGRWAAVGQPYPQDLEQRDNAQRLASQAARGSLEEQFYRALTESAEASISQSMAETDLFGDGRDWGER